MNNNLQEFLDSLKTEQDIGNAAVLLCKAIKPEVNLLKVHLNPINSSPDFYTINFLNVYIPSPNPNVWLKSILVRDNYTFEISTKGIYSDSEKLKINEALEKIPEYKWDLILKNQSSVLITYCSGTGDSGSA